MAFEAKNPGTSRRGGLFDSLKVLTATLIAIAHTRLELLSTELEEEWLRLSALAPKFDDVFTAAISYSWSLVETLASTQLE
jgi:hypothetical protein